MSIAKEIEDIARDLIRHQHDHPPVRDLNREMEKRATFAGRAGADLAGLLGSWPAIFIQVGLISIWMVLNGIGLVTHWDAFPFLLLNLILTVQVVLWLSLVLMAFNRQAERERIRAQHDYESQVRTEDETRALMNHLMHQDEILLQIIHRLDRSDREQKRLMRRLDSE